MISAFLYTFFQFLPSFTSIQHHFSKMDHLTISRAETCPIHSSHLPKIQSCDPLIVNSQFPTGTILLINDAFFSVCPSDDFKNVPKKQ